MDEQQQPQSSWETLEAEMAMDVSRRARLVKAVIAGELDVVKGLVEQDHEVAMHTLNRKTTMLVLAVENNHLELSRYLINRGVKVNGNCHMRLSPLHTAARLHVRPEKCYPIDWIDMMCACHGLI